MRLPPYGAGITRANILNASAWRNLELPFGEHTAYAAFVRRDSRLLLIAREHDRMTWEYMGERSERPSEAMDGGPLNLYTMDLNTGKAVPEDLSVVPPGWSNRWPWNMQDMCYVSTSRLAVMADQAHIAIYDADDLAVMACCTLPLSFSWDQQATSQPFSRRKNWSRSELPSEPSKAPTSAPV